MLTVKTRTAHNYTSDMFSDCYCEDKLLPGSCCHSRVEHYV